MAPQLGRTLVNITSRPEPIVSHLTSQQEKMNFNTLVPFSGGVKVPLIGVTNIISEAIFHAAAHFDFKALEI